MVFPGGLRSILRFLWFGLGFGRFLSHRVRRLGVMGETLTIDQREQQLIDVESLVGRLRAQSDRQDLEVLDRAQVATGDGSWSLSEWVGTWLDVGLVSAMSLVRTMRWTVDRSGLREALASGVVSFDRVEALSKIPGRVGLLPHLDVGGVCREAARRTRITAESEIKTAESNPFVCSVHLG